MIPAALLGLGGNPGVVIKITPRGVGKKKLMGYTFVVKGKCTTCSRVFSNPQDFYEHLDDYVLRVVAQQGFSVPINSLLFVVVVLFFLCVVWSCLVCVFGLFLFVSLV